MFPDIHFNYLNYAQYNDIYDCLINYMRLSTALILNGILSMERKRSEDVKRGKAGHLIDGIAPHQPFLPAPTITGWQTLEEDSLISMDERYISYCQVT